MTRVRNQKTNIIRTSSMERAFGNLDAVHVCFTMFTSTIQLQSNHMMVLKDTGTKGERTAAGESRAKWAVKPMRPWDARYASWSLQESRVSRGYLQKVYRTHTHYKDPILHPLSQWSSQYSFGGVAPFCKRSTECQTPLTGMAPAP